MHSICLLKFVFFRTWSRNETLLIFLVSAKSLWIIYFLIFCRPDLRLRIFHCWTVDFNSKNKNYCIKVCLVGEIMVEIRSKFSRFSEHFITIRLVATIQHGAHAIESLPFVWSQKPSKSGLQNFVLFIWPAHWVTNKFSH